MSMLVRYLITALESKTSNQTALRIDKTLANFLLSMNDITSLKILKDSTFHEVQWED